MTQTYDMLVIGGGPGGYTAALYAARAGLRVLVLEKLSAGGQMALTDQIDNYPGFPDGVDGFALAEQMQQQAERFGAQTLLAEVTALQLDGKIKQAQTTEGMFQAKTVVFATGANPRQLDVPGEQALSGRKVHYCAACDGMRYRDKTVLVVGGGNTAVADALQLSRIARKVILVHRRDTLRATKVYHAPLQQAANVEFIWNSTPVQLHDRGAQVVVTLKNRVTEQEQTVECDGVFVSIGRAPATQLVKDQLLLDPGGYILAYDTTKTNIPGVFAVGDVRAKLLRQIVTAVADGAIAAHYAEEYLAEALP